MRISDWSSDVCSSDLLAKDETQATELFRSESKSAIETALIDLGVVQPDIQLRESKDKSLHIWASFEHAQSQCGPYPPGNKGTDNCRSDERRDGNESVSTCSTRGSAEYNTQEKS